VQRGVSEAEDRCMMNDGYEREMLVGGFLFFGRFVSVLTDCESINQCQWHTFQTTTRLKRSFYLVIP